MQDLKGVSEYFLERQQVWNQMLIKAPPVHKNF